MDDDTPTPALESDGRTDDGAPVLAESIRHHLGRLLADAYAPMQDGSGTDGFADLLARLDAAVGEAREQADVAIRSALIEVTPALRRYALSLTHDATAADDLVQDTMLRAWRSRAGFASGTNFEAWTFTILRNQFYSDRRKHGREVQDEEGVHAARLVALPAQSDRLDLADVRAALGRLSPEMREALVLVGAEGVSYESAAAIMGCRVGTVKSRVSRARAHLARELGYGGEEVGQDPLTLSAMGERA